MMSTGYVLLSLPQNIFRKFGIEKPLAVTKID